MQLEKKPFGETFWKIMYQSFQRAFKAHGKKKRFKETSSSLAGIGKAGIGKYRQV